MKTKAIVIRIEGENAAQLRSLWAEMKSRHLLAPGERMHSVIYGHLLNLTLRWQDAINESDSIVLAQQAIDKSESR